MLHTNYNASSKPDFQYNVAESVCNASHSQVFQPDTRMFDKLAMQLRLWRHTPETGDIWLGRDVDDIGRCRIIRVCKGT